MAKSRKEEKESALRDKLKELGFELSQTSANFHETVMSELDYIQKQLEKKEITGYAVLPTCDGFEFYEIVKKRK